MYYGIACFRNTKSHLLQVAFSFYPFSPETSRIDQNTLFRRESYILLSNKCSTEESRQKRGEKYACVSLKYGVFAPYEVIVFPKTIDCNKICGQYGFYCREGGVRRLRESISHTQPLRRGARWVCANARKHH